MQLLFILLVNIIFSLILLKYLISLIFRKGQNGRKDVVLNLIAHGADINQATDIGATPLFISVEFARKEIVQILLDKGADVNKGRSDIGATPLYIA